MNTPELLIESIKVLISAGAITGIVRLIDRKLSQTHPRLAELDSIRKEYKAERDEARQEVLKLRTEFMKCYADNIDTRNALQKQLLEAEIERDRYIKKTQDLEEKITELEEELTQLREQLAKVTENQLSRSQSIQLKN